MDRVFIKDQVFISSIGGSIGQDSGLLYGTTDERLPRTGSYVASANIDCSGNRGVKHLDQSRSEEVLHGQHRAGDLPLLVGWVLFRIGSLGWLVSRRHASRKWEAAEG